MLGSAGGSFLGTLALRRVSFDVYVDARWPFKRRGRRVVSCPSHEPGRCPCRIVLGCVGLRSQLPVDGLAERRGPVAADAPTQARCCGGRSRRSSGRRHCVPRSLWSSGASWGHLPYGCTRVSTVIGNCVACPDWTYPSPSASVDTRASGGSWSAGTMSAVACRWRDSPRPPGGLRVRDASIDAFSAGRASRRGTVSDAEMDALRAPERPQLHRHPANGSSRVRHHRGALAVDGNAPCCQRRAVRSLIPAAAAAAANVFPDIRFSRNRRTCASVTNPSSTRKTGSVTRRCVGSRSRRSRPRRPAKLALITALHITDRLPQSASSHSSTDASVRCGAGPEESMAVGRAFASAFRFMSSKRPGPPHPVDRHPNRHPPSPD